MLNYVFRMLLATFCALFVVFVFSQGQQRVFVDAVYAGRLDKIEGKVDSLSAEFRKFQGLGPRFTAPYGLGLCEDLREIQRELGLQLEDCDAMRRALVGSK